MRGISEERLREIANQTKRFDDITLLNRLLKNECEELNPWLPIENAPKDRIVRLFYPENKLAGYDRLVLDRTYSDYFKLHSDRLPTHYQELPDDPV